MVRMKRWESSLCKMLVFALLLNLAVFSIVPREADANGGAAPVWPTEASLSASAATETSVVLSWPIAIVEQGMSVTYHVYQDGSEYVGQSIIPSITVEGLSPGATYTFDVIGTVPDGYASDPLTATFTMPQQVFVISFADQALEEAIRRELGSYESPLQGPITTAHMLTLTDLYLEGKGITNLDGLQYALNLKSLTLWNNYALSDITPLSTLKLDYLDLDNTNVSDVTVLRTIYNNGGFRGQENPHIYLNGILFGPGSGLIIQELASLGVRINYTPSFTDYGDYVQLQSSKPAVKLGETFSVTVAVAGVIGLYGYQFELDYDETAFRVVPGSIVPHPDFIGESASGGNYTFSHTVTAAGNLRVVATLQGNTGSVAPAGESLKVASVTFEKIGDGSNQFHVPGSKTVLSDVGGFRYALTGDADFVLNDYVAADEVDIVNRFGTDVLPVGEEIDLGINITPNATYNTVIWTSSNPVVAAVTSEGVVSAVSAGTVTITATTVDGASDEIAIHVGELDAGFSLKPSKGIVGVGEYLNVTVAKTSRHDLSSFEIFIPVWFYWDWELVSIVPHDEIADAIEFKVEAFDPSEMEVEMPPGYWIRGHVLDGSLAMDEDEDEDMDLFTFVLRHAEGEYGIESEGGGSRVLDFGFPYGYTIDSGNAYHLSEEQWLDIPVADPDIDVYPGVEITDLVKIARLFGMEVDWEGEGWSDHHELDFNRDGKIDTEELSFIHLRVLYENFDPDVPATELPKLPELPGWPDWEFPGEPQ